MKFETFGPILPEPVNGLYEAWNGRPSLALIYVFHAALLGVTYQVAKRSGTSLAGAACVLNLVFPLATRLGVAGYLVTEAVKDPKNLAKVALGVAGYFSTTPLFQDWYVSTSKNIKKFICSSAAVVGACSSVSFVSNAILNVGFRHISEAACMLSLVDAKASKWGISAYFVRKAMDAVFNASSTKNYTGVATKVAVAAFACLLHRPIVRDKLVFIEQKLYNLTKPKNT